MLLPLSTDGEPRVVTLQHVPLQKNKCTLKNMRLYLVFFSSMNLEEEVDNLRVKTSQDTATIHELKTCLEQEREGNVRFNK